MTIKEAAQKEQKRLAEIFSELEIVNKGEDFYSFAQNYFNDGKYFFEKKKYIEAFEAFVISWAYLDIGIKLKMFIPTLKIKKYFTVD